MSDAKPDPSQHERRAGVLAFGALAAVFVWTFAELTEELFSRAEDPNDILAVDRNILVTASRMRRAWLTPIALDVSAMGSEVVLGLFTFITVLLLLMVRRPRHAVQMLVASLGAGVLTTVVKATLARARPNVVPHIAQVSGFAYPSGHSLASTAIFTTAALVMAQHLRRRMHKVVLGVVVTCLIAVVSGSRIYLGVHYPSDVAGGLVAGCAWSLLVSAVTAPAVSGSTDAARALVKRAMRLPFARKARLIARLVKDRRVPWSARIPLVALLLYLAMPLDIIPDFIPVIGHLDDLLVAGIAVWWFMRTCPPDVATGHIDELEKLPLTRFERASPWLVGVALATMIGSWALHYAASPRVPR